jgi:hypothetical protein
VEVVTRADRPDLHEVAAAVFKERWPEFIFHGDGMDRRPPVGSIL